MRIDHLLVGLLLGCSQLFLGLGMKKPVLGAVGLGLEVLAAIPFPPAAFILFPLYVLLMLLVGNDGTNAGRAPARYRIVGCCGPLTAREYELSAKQPALEFGVQSNEITFPPGTPGVSRHHCKVILKGTGAYLIDLESTYGTYIRIPFTQLQPNTEYELRDRMEFCLGSDTVVFRIYDDASPSG